MRLINARTLEFKEFFGESVPPYAILSHTWGDDEVTFQDWQDMAKASTKAGYSKIRGACDHALARDLNWVWVDTNCIDKSSSAELTENINSMFRYYAEAYVCFAYMSDVPTANTPDRQLVLSQFRKSRWFTRGWTLQELLAPMYVVFFASDWTRIGRKDGSLTDAIADITNIGKRFLTPAKLYDASVAQKMSWVSKRKTTRLEDNAYCMLGIFGVNMPLIYGEGRNAFARLQEEIIKNNNDHTIFCWTWDETVPEYWGSFLAPSPAQFRDSCYYKRRLIGYRDGSKKRPLFSQTFSMTNAGLSIELPIVYIAGSCFAVVGAVGTSKEEDEGCQGSDVPRDGIFECIRVISADPWDTQLVRRAPHPSVPISLQLQTPGTGRIRQQPLLICKKHYRSTYLSSLEVERWRAVGQNGYVFFLAWDSNWLWSCWEAAGPPSLDVCLHVAAGGRGSSTGALLAKFLVPVDRDPKSRRSSTAYLFLGVRNGAFFCQLFAPANGQALDEKQRDAAMQDLERQFSNLTHTFDQRTYVSQSLQTRVTVDCVKYDPVVGTNFGLLRILDEPGSDSSAGIFTLAGLN